MWSKAPCTVFSILLAVGLGSLTADETDSWLVSRADGRWSDPAIWSARRVPAAGDRVFVAGGTRVEYDVESDAVIHTLGVAGRLSFASDRDTLLNVGILRVQGGDLPEASGRAGVEDVHDHDHGAAAPGAVLEIGRPDRPIPRGVTARVRLHYIEGMDRKDAPAIVCRPGGRMEFHGAPMRRTWLKLDEDVEPGAAAVLLSEDAEGWAVGDELIVTGSTHRSSFEGNFRSRPELLDTETRRVAKLDGRRVTLDRPLERPHLGHGRFRSEVANLTRTVVVESAEPDGIRGHTMYHRFSRGGISYARFAHLGKEGTLGRYPIHFHRVRDTMRGSSVVGAAVVDSHNRWVTIHGTQYLVLRDTVGFRSVGHGFFLEDATEVYNVLDRNLGVQAVRGKRLPDQVLPFDPNDGAAFWWANGRNTLVRNVACENDQYGYRYDIQKRSNFDSHLEVRSPGGKSELVDVRSLPIYRFEANETHSEGLYGVALAGTDGVGPDPSHPHRLKGLKIWQVHYALRTQVPMVLAEDVVIDHAAYGIYRPWFDHHVYRELEISHTSAEPFNRGLDDRSEQHGPLAVDGLTFRGVYRNRHVPLIQISADDVTGRAESHFRRVTVERREGEREPRALVNLGGGPRRDPRGKGVPIYLHDYYGDGKHAKVVSTRAKDLLADGLDYRPEPPLTGDESAVAHVSNVDFPAVLKPIDDQPPATVITWPRRGIPARLEDGLLVVRGTSTDDVKTARVLVNGVEARDVDFGFHRWEARLEDLKPGELVLEAHAVDAAGNVEKTAHRLEVVIEAARERF